MTQTAASGAPAAGDVTTASAAGHANKHLPVLVLGAFGVVYGDIGTSPIYAFRQAFAARGDGGTVTGDVIGLLSLIVWALTITVSIKYVFFVTRADNKGEGGTLSLMSLVRSTFSDKAARWIVALGVIGAALFFGDAIITPAISVLSAVEGLEVVQPGLASWVSHAHSDPVAVFLAAVRHGARLGDLRAGDGDLVPDVGDRWHRPHHPQSGGALGDQSR